MKRGSRRKNIRRAHQKLRAGVSAVSPSPTRRRDTTPVPVDSRSHVFFPPRVCMFCGDLNPEAHHICGKANDNDLTGDLCQKDHIEIHEDLRATGVDLSHDTCRTVLERLGDILVAVGTFLIRLGTTLCEWAGKLLGIVLALDQHYPQWRDLPEAY